MCAMRTSGRTANDEAVPEPADGTAPGAAALPGQAAGQAGGGRDAVPDATGAGRPAPRNSDFVQSLDRGLAVIRSFGPDRERLSLSEVARATGLTRAAARRFLLTLVKLGYVRSDGREFSLRPRVLELGYAYLSGLALPDVAAPHLEELVARLHESSSISVLDGHHVVYVARVPTKRIMTVAISVGTRFPAYATSMGRVLVAAPIRGAPDVGSAAINVSAHAARVSIASLRGDILPALLDTAKAIEADLQAQGGT